jgi:phage terminase large subunit-like protein
MILKMSGFRGSEGCPHDASWSVEIKAPDSAIQPPDIRASGFIFVSFTPLRSLFVVGRSKCFSHHEEHEGTTEPGIGASWSVEIKARDSAIQPPDIKASGFIFVPFTPLRSLFVVARSKCFSHHEEHEEHEGTTEPGMGASRTPRLWS